MQNDVLESASQSMEYRQIMDARFRGLGFRVQLGFRVRDRGLVVRVQGFGFRRRRLRVTKPLPAILLYPALATWRPMGLSNDV